MPYINVLQLWSTAFISKGGGGNFLYIHSASQREGDVAKVTTRSPFPASIGLCHLRFWFFMHGSDRMGTLKVTSVLLFLFSCFYVFRQQASKDVFFLLSFAMKMIHHSQTEGLIWNCQIFFSSFTHPIITLHSAYCQSLDTQRREWKSFFLQIIHQSMSP